MYVENLGEKCSSNSSYLTGFFWSFFHLSDAQIAARSCGEEEEDGGGEEGEESASIHVSFHIRLNFRFIWRHFSTELTRLILSIRGKTLL